MHKSVQGHLWHLPSSQILNTTQPSRSRIVAVFLITSRLCPCSVVLRLREASPDLFHRAILFGTLKMALNAQQRIKSGKVEVDNGLQYGLFYNVYYWIYHIALDALDRSHLFLKPSA